MTQTWWQTVGSFGVGVVLAAFITGWLTRRRESSAWLRTEQMRIYEQFHRAGWALITEIEAGSLDKALQSPDYDGLDAARETVKALQAAALNSAREVLVVGARRSLRATRAFTSTVVEVQALVTPVQAGAGSLALNLRLFGVEALRADLIVVSFANRTDLGLRVGVRVRLLVAKHGLRFMRGASVLGDALVVEEPSRGLVDYRVRRSDGAPLGGADYRVDPASWIPLQMQNGIFRQPMAGLLWLVGGKQWRLEVSNALSEEDYLAVLWDALRFVQHHGVRRTALAVAWVEGVSIDGFVSEVHFWPAAQVPQLRAASGPTRPIPPSKPVEGWRTWLPIVRLALRRS